MKCLLVETKDKKFLTEEKNFNELIDFSKIFEAKMTRVNIEKCRLLTLNEIAFAFCNSESNKIEYKISRVRNRSEMIELANKINKYIKDKFKNKTNVSLKELKEKFKKYKLSDTALCNHIRRAKKQLENQGLKFFKISTGVYTIR